MRISSVAAVVIALLLLGSGNLNAQTADIQRTVDTRLALKRLGCGIRIAESIQVLAEAALQEPVRNLQRAGAVLRRLFDPLITRPADSVRVEKKP
jgi:hypothetical protein